MVRSGAVMAVALLALSGCAAPNGRVSMTPNQAVGTVLGATAGGVVGSVVGGGSGQLWAVGVGTVAGAAVGHEIGTSWDRAYYTSQQPEQITWVSGQYAPNQYGTGYANVSYARPLVYKYPARPYPGYYRPNVSSVPGCQQLYVVNPYSPAGYACQAPNGNWYINE